MEHDSAKDWVYDKQKPNEQRVRIEGEEMPLNGTSNNEGNPVGSLCHVSPGQQLSAHQLVHAVLQARKKKPARHRCNNKQASFILLASSRIRRMESANTLRYNIASHV